MVTKKMNLAKNGPCAMRSQNDKRQSSPRRLCGPAHQPKPGVPPPPSRTTTDISPRTHWRSTMPAAPPVKNRQLYIDGQWCDSASGKKLAVENPATEETIAEV